MREELKRQILYALAGSIEVNQNKIDVLRILCNISDEQAASYIARFEAKSAEVMDLVRNGRDSSHLDEQLHEMAFELADMAISNKQNNNYR